MRSSGVRPADLIDAGQVARLLGLGHRNSTWTYLRRYADFPRPLIDRGPHNRLWLRSDILKWQATHPQRRPHQ
jgi:glutathione-regulated potassium-efflux system ancillary protein KefG